MHEIFTFDNRRDILVGKSAEETVDLAVEQFIKIANASIQDHNYFAVALSGGSTPQAIYKSLASTKNRNRVDWEKVLLFWSDERSVEPTHPESNYKMAMEASFNGLPIPKENIFRMKAEGDIEAHAKEYENTLKEKISSQQFDLIMLGMGEDGHTASLFPQTHALHTVDRLVVANYIPQKNTWRMTLTYDCINSAHHITIYVIGKNKAEMVKQILTSTYDPDQLPIQQVGTPTHKALWLLDREAASKLE